jgi:hypothetical protein
MRDADSKVDTRDKTVARRADPRVAASEPERAFPRRVINSAPAPRAAMAPGHVMFLQRTAGNGAARQMLAARPRAGPKCHSLGMAMARTEPAFSACEASSSQGAVCEGDDRLEAPKCLSR